MSHDKLIGACFGDERLPTARAVIASQDQDMIRKAPGANPPATSRAGVRPAARDGRTSIP